MSWTATERYGARTAPAGLALVQELVNTHAVGRGDHPDLLADHGTALRWLREAAGQWASARGLGAPQLSLSETGLHAVRDLRTTVREMLAVHPDRRIAGSFGGTSVLTQRARVQLVSDGHDQVAIAPVGSDEGWLISAVWSEIFLAQRSGDWSRIKLCREPDCASAFYDTSRNSSGVWHNVRACGNITNLRASRARRKSASQ